MLPLHHQCASKDMTVMVFSPNAKGNSSRRFLSISIICWKLVTIICRS